MAKSNNQTAAGEGSVDQFVDSLTDKQQAEDSRKLLDIFNSVTGKPPVMWGTAMIGYGKLNITYTSGREVEWFNIVNADDECFVAKYRVGITGALRDKSPLHLLHGHSAITQ